MTSCNIVTLSLPWSGNAPINPCWSKIDPSAFDCGHFHVLEMGEWLGHEKFNTYGLKYDIDLVVAFVNIFEIVQVSYNGG